EAFKDTAADRDRNGHVSVAEAFEYAKAKVAQSFQQKGLILTEHATIDEGLSQPGAGQLAASIFLAPSSGSAALNVDTSDPAMRALVDERNAIEQQIAALRLKRGSMDEAQYDSQMEKLLTDLAVKTRAIRARQSKKE